MQQLECSTSIDNALICGIAARTDKTPCAKCWTKSLASGEHKSADLGQWGTKVFINLCPTRVLEIEQCAQPRVNSRSNVRK
jgi:hypothetical protein